jgi:hypothetical protein
MTSRFTERLLAGVTGERRYPSVRPALIPEMIPEAYRLPEEGTRPPDAPRLTNEADVAPEATPVEGVLEVPSIPATKSKETTTKDSEAPRQSAVGKTDAIAAAAEMAGRKEGRTAAPDTARVPPVPEATAAEPALPAVRRPPNPAVTEAPRTAERRKPSDREPEAISEPASRLRPGPIRRERKQPEEERSVTLHIGRIEVRAVMPEKLPEKGAQAPALSLEDYLRRKRGGTASE